MKTRTGTAAALAVLTIFGATAASAQGLHFDQRGWHGNRNPHHGWQGDRGYHRGWGGWNGGVHRGYEDPHATGSLGCRTITIQKQDGFGRFETKRIQKCG